MSNYVPRAEWKALPPVSQEPLTTHPLKFVVSSFTGSKECFTQEDCIKEIQQVQLRDMAYGFPDLRYNFLVGGDGYVYEGRGWYTNVKKVGPEWHDCDGRSVDIAFIGPHPVPYTRNYPAIHVKLARDKLILGGLEKGLIDPSFNSSPEPKMDMDLTQEETEAVLEQTRANFGKLDDDE